MNRLKFWRIERGISQIELAAASGVPRHIIQLGETAVALPHERYQARLAETLGVPVKKLFPEVADRKSRKKKGKLSNFFRELEVDEI